MHINISNVTELQARLNFDIKIVYDYTRQRQHRYTSLLLSSQVDTARY